MDSSASGTSEVSRCCKVGDCSHNTLTVSSSSAVLLTLTPLRLGMSLKVEMLQTIKLRLSEEAVTLQLILNVYPGAVVFLECLYEGQ